MLALLVDPLARLASLSVLVLVTALVLALSWTIQRVVRARAFASLRRWAPLVIASLWVGVLSLWLRRSIPADAQWIARAAIAGVLVVAAMPWLRNVVHALVFGLEGRYRIGDDLRIGSVEGRLSAIHFGVLVLRAGDGTEISIPHATLAREHVVRLNLDVRDAPCELLLSAPDELDVHVVAELARAAAALSPFAAPRVEPQVLVQRGEPGTPQQVRLQGFVFDREVETRFRSDVSTRFQRTVRDAMRAMRSPETAGTV